MKSMSGRHALQSSFKKIKMFKQYQPGASNTSVDLFLKRASIIAIICAVLSLVMSISSVWFVFCGVNSVAHKFFLQTSSGRFVDITGLKK